jgi:hypothetical protein
MINETDREIIKARFRNGWGYHEVMCFALLRDNFDLFVYYEKEIDKCLAEIKEEDTKNEIRRKRR